MKQGYVFLGIDDFGKTKNISRAYSLSLSLKIADPDRKTCVVVNKLKDVPKRYENGFDYIVELPFGRTDTNHHNIFIDFWQIYFCTPFDENIFVNTYSLAIGDVGSLWDIAPISDMTFATLKTFRREKFDFKSVAIRKNNLPAYDSDLIFFRKGETALAFFKMADPIFKYWRDIYREIHTNYQLNDFDFNLLVNTTIKMLQEKYQTHELFDYVDLTADFVQTDDDQEKKFKWVESLNIWFTKNLDLKINNHRVSGIVVYRDPNLLTNEMIEKINEQYKSIQKTRKKT